MIVGALVCWEMRKLWSNVLTVSTLANYSSLLHKADISFWCAKNPNPLQQLNLDLQQAFSCISDLSCCADCFLHNVTSLFILLLPLYGQRLYEALGLKGLEHLEKHYYVLNEEIV